MGAWAVGPFDNDTSGDWLIKLHNFLLETISKQLFPYDEVRAVAEVLIRLDRHFIYNADLIKTTIEKLRGIRKDEKWIDSWKDQHKIKVEVVRQINALKKLLRTKAKP